VLDIGSRTDLFLINIPDNIMVLGGISSVLLPDDSEELKFKIMWCHDLLKPYKILIEESEHQIIEKVKEF